MRPYSVDLRELKKRMKGQMSDRALLRALRVLDLWLKENLFGRRSESAKT